MSNDEPYASKIVKSLVNTVQSRRLILIEKVIPYDYFEFIGIAMNSFEHCIHHKPLCMPDILNERWMKCYNGM